MTEAERVAASLTEDLKARLRVWPNGHYSTFRGEPDATANRLCELGIGVIMPWKHGRQMGLTSKLGLKVHDILRTKESDK